MITPIFSPWYAQGQIKDMEEINKQIYKKIEDNLDKAKLAKLYWNCSVWTTFKSQENNLIFKDEINLCASKVVDPVVAIADELGHNFSKLQIDSWFNAYKDFQWQEYHHHLPSILSGVYFVSYDPETHGKLTFKNPLGDWRIAQSAKMNYLPNDPANPQDQLLTENFTPSIKEGDIIIFPSGLPHAVAVSNKKSNKLRITFSFNVTYKE